MTVKSTVMEIGTWHVDLSDQAPGWIFDAFGKFPYLMVTSGRVPVDVAARIAEPLHRGIILRRDGHRLSGADMAWHMGSPSDEPMQTDGWGPWFQGGWVDKGPVAVMGDLTGFNGMGYSVGPGVSGNMTALINGNVRNAVDNVVCAQLGCEWRMRTSNVVELYKRANALASPVAIITDDPGGREPGLVSWRVDTIDTSVSDEDRRNRMVLRWENAGTTSTSSTPTHSGWTAYGGAVLQMAEFRKSSGTSAANVVAERDFRHAVNLVRAQDATVTVTDTAAVSMLGDPGGLLGSAVGVYVPDEGFYDPAVSPVSFRGRQVWPMSTRVAEVEWPITRGMGVYVDARWSQDGAGELIDVSDWVEWEADPADPGSSSTVLRLGGLPRWWDGRIRR